MNSKFEIKEKKYLKKNGLNDSELTLLFTGLDVSIINSLRRISLNYVPIYSFCKESIIIENNTSIYDNDYMKIRLSQITIPNLKNDLFFLEDKYWKNINYSNTEREKHKNDKDLFQLIINSENNTNEIMNVTTNDCLQILNDKKLNKFDNKYPHLIIKLRPGESFKCKADAVLGVGNRNNIWSSVKNIFYDNLDEHKFLLTIKSTGQLNEYDILKKSCDIMIHKLNTIKNLLLNNSSTNKNSLELETIISNENHTLGNVLTTSLQKNKNISYAGYSKPDLLIKEIKIKITSKNKTPIFYLVQTCNELIKIYENIKKKILKR